MPEEKAGTEVQESPEDLKRSIKNGMGLVVLSVTMTIIAIGACAFAVYTRMSASESINDCAYRDDTKTIKPDNVDPSSNPSIDTPEIAGDTEIVNTSEYLYVGEWGVKIKLPSDQYVWYRYIPNTGSQALGTLVLTADSKEAHEYHNYGDYDEGFGLLHIYRMEAGVTEWPGRESAPAYIGTFNGYSYFYSTPQSCSKLASQNNACQEEQNVFHTLRDTFINLDNWSTIQ